MYCLFYSVDHHVGVGCFDIDQCQQGESGRFLEAGIAFTLFIPQRRRWIRMCRTQRLRADDDNGKDNATNPVTGNTHQAIVVRIV